MDPGKGVETGGGPRGELPSLSGLDGGPGLGVAVWERKPSEGHIMLDT